MTAEHGNTLIRRLEFFAEMGRAGNFSGAALLVAFSLLYRHMNGRTGRCNPSKVTLAEETGLSRASITRALRELEEDGWWKIDGGGNGAGRGHTNNYRPNFRTPEKGINPEPLLASEKEPKGLNPEPEKGSCMSPKPVKTQEEDSYTVGRFATDREGEGSPPEILRRIFWRVYPSRGPHPNPKKPALAKFDALVKGGIDPAVIIRGAENYARYVAEHVPDRRHVAQALTWLNQRRWEDHQEPPAAEPVRRRVGSW